MLNPRECIIQGRSIPAEILGELTETPVNADGLNDLLRDDGYLFLRSVFDVDDVM